MAEDAAQAESRDGGATPVANGGSDVFEVVADDGAVILKNNRLTIDDASRQALSQQEIEQLKKSSGGKEIIEKILANHAGLDEKTTFSKAKYTLRKTRKYLKRFTTIPVDIGSLIQHILEKEPPRIMELREETLGLTMAWSHAHFSGDDAARQITTTESARGSGRWLAIDDTGGLVVVALAERMGILYHESEYEEASLESQTNGARKAALGHSSDQGDLPTSPHPPRDKDEPPLKKPRIHPPESVATATTSHRDFAMPASSNTITVLHPAVQPNLSVLKYFGYDTNHPDTSHPLHTHLKPLSWLQLLHPDEDPTYREPEHVPEHTLQTWKSGKRGMYWKKRRRWERCKSIVDETKAGGLDGLVIASSMEAATILPHVVPLIKGGGHIVIYSPTPEPLISLIDLYSKDRRTAYINLLAEGETPDPVDFPVDPRLLLAPTLQTSRVTSWQVLPARTHPLMTSRGGAEGYVFTARRVLPLDSGVVARGNFSTKRRKVEGGVVVDGAENET